MLSFRASLALLLLAVLATAQAFAVRTRTHHAATTAHTHAFHKAAPKAAAHRLHGQQAIDPERVMQIQQALIRAHYLTIDANGKWDATTEAAMQKYQADQGWQTKLMPDSRALLKLGLGPDYSTAINAKDSKFGAPPPGATIPAPLVNGFTAAAGVSR